MNKATIKHKDIFDIAIKSINAKENGHSVIIPHVCSNSGFYSKGFSSRINQYYPDIKINYQLLGKSFLQRNPGYVQFVDVDREPEYNRRLVVATMIGQNSLSPKRPINYAYIVKSMLGIKNFILKNFNQENKVYVYLYKNMLKEGRGNIKFFDLLIEDVWGGLNIEYF